VASPPTWWGFHQLDPRWAQRLVADADIAPGAVVLDVGAGIGALTDPLVRCGARVVAIEVHPGRARQLRQRFGDAIVVVRADAADLRLPRQPYDVVANPPFGITTALLRRLLQPGSRLRTAHLILPEHAARRWAGAGAPGRARWSRTFAVQLGDRMPRRAFQPPPARDARILVIRRLHPTAGGRNGVSRPRRPAP